MAQSSEVDMAETAPLQSNGTRSSLASYWECRVGYVGDCLTNNHQIEARRSSRWRRRRWPRSTTMSNWKPNAPTFPHHGAQSWLLNFWKCQNIFSVLRTQIVESKPTMKQARCYAEAIDHFLSGFTYSHEENCYIRQLPNPVVSFRKLSLLLLHLLM